jgi:alpha-L-rhamnosidase
MQAMLQLRRGAAAMLVLTSIATMAIDKESRSRAQPAGRDWRIVTAETRPWTRWWWHGSAVDRASLTSELRSFQAIGLGGVEITPIYGVRGAERRFIPYLSDKWVGMLEHTTGEAQRLGMGVDMATGTGWPFGGPWVGDDDAPRTIAHRTWTIDAGRQLTEPVRLRQTPLVRAVGNQIYEFSERTPGEPAPLRTPQQPQIRKGARPIQLADLVEPVAANTNLQALALEQVKYPRDLPLVAVVAQSDSGQVFDLTADVGADRRLEWTAPPGRWTVYALFADWHGKLVERAAPGGEGNVIDHFSERAIRSYLARFDRALPPRSVGPFRAFFNDSYEVDDAAGQADWTPGLLDEFSKRRGYDLRHHLPALLTDSADERATRVLADYRETVSDLLLETFTVEWADWARRRGAIVRNQAHGSPANLLDLYAASDIPETEGTEIPRFKWASSAANVTGRRLVSAEAATWLSEHFSATLADVRAAVDLLFLGGVNHVVYHGTAYSPPGDPWPGWQFYASVDFSPRNAWWDDLAALNRYVTRVQSFLQSGRPDHDVLLYFPFYDAVSTRGPARLTHFGGANARTAAVTFEEASAFLQARAFTCDYISDRQLQRTRVAGGRLTSPGGGSYAVIVLPASRFIPLDTIERVLALARDGATVIAFRGMPSDVSGLADLEVRRARFKRILEDVRFVPADSQGISVALVGRGRVIEGDDLGGLLARAGVEREPLVDRGLQFVRRADGQGRFYYLANRSGRPIDGWIPLRLEAPATLVFDPMLGRRGSARVRRGSDGSLDVYLQIPVGESLIVTAAPRETTRYPTHAVVDKPVALEGPWSVRFVNGGPRLPEARTIDRLVSWTTFGGAAGRSFSGTAAYSTTFARPQAAADAWKLDLGGVHESARVRINGHDVATLIGPTYSVVLEPGLLRAENDLEVFVTNLSANRIADLDSRGVPWKKFYNVNMPARLAANRGEDGLFTAAPWEPLDSGLIGPVTLSALRVAH